MIRSQAQYLKLYLNGYMCKKYYMVSLSISRYVYRSLHFKTNLFEEFLKKFNLIGIVDFALEFLSGLFMCDVFCLCFFFVCLSFGL